MRPVVIEVPIAEQDVSTVDELRVRLASRHESLVRERPPVRTRTHLNSPHSPPAKLASHQTWRWQPMTTPTVARSLEPDRDQSQRGGRP